VFQRFQGKSLPWVKALACEPPYTLFLLAAYENHARDELSDRELPRDSRKVTTMEEAVRPNTNGTVEGSLPAK
jgi:hypothetical protein